MKEFIIICVKWVYLESKVNELIEDGYELNGDTFQVEGGRLLQAMRLRNETKTKA